jgi:Lon protease-like protein
MTRKTIPIFPLHSVLFPGGPLALRIFEARYLDMVSRCLRDESGFGVALIREGDEVGQAAEVYEVGTLGEISYWEQRKDGLLGITVTGEQRFRILDSHVEANQLRIAEVELLPNPEAVALPEKYQHMVHLLERMLDQLGHPYITMERDIANAEWVGARLVELLPLELEQKQ